MEGKASLDELRQLLADEKYVPAEEARARVAEVEGKLRAAEREWLRDEFIESGRAYRHKPPFQRGAEEERFYAAVEAYEAWERAQGVRG